MTPVPAETPPPAPAAPAIAALTPPGLDGIWLGMPKADVLAARPKITALPDYPASDIDGPRTTAEEEIYDGTLGTVTYHFRDDGGAAPLYMMEIYYQDTAALDRLFAERYAPHGIPTTNGAAQEVYVDDVGPPAKVWVLGRLYLKLR